MKPPLTYYGGKQRLKDAVCHVLYQAPNWSLDGAYVEPCFGGGVVYFNKVMQEHETINDINDNLITFYRVVKDREGFRKVKEMMEGTLCSRSEHDRTLRIMKGEEEADDITRAWAVFAHLNLSFSHCWLGGYAYSMKWSSQARIFANKKKRFTEEVCERLQNTDIECRDALEVMASRDSEATLFYLDPPYAGTEQAYAKNEYGDSDLEALLSFLEGLKGHFALSMFSHPLLDEAASRNGWHALSLDLPYGVQVTDEKREKGKREMIVASYPFSLNAKSLERKKEESVNEGSLSLFGEEEKIF